MASRRTVRHQRPRAASPTGYVPEMESLVKDLAAAAKEQLDETNRAAGAPWRSSRLTEQQALQKMDEWDYVPPAPEVQKAAAALNKGEAVRASLDAVKRRQRAMERGEWHPLTEPTPPPMPQTPPLPTPTPAPPPVVPGTAAPTPALPAPPAGGLPEEPVYAPV